MGIALVYQLCTKYTTTVFYDEYTSPIGKISIYASARGITELTVASKRSRALNPNVHTKAMQTWLTAYFAGKNPAHSIALDVQGSPFFSIVWQTLTQVPSGTTVSYKDLARKAGNPKAVRAAGTAMATNKVPLYIPCHRVVKSDGSLGNYGPGPSKKQWLLEFEKTV